MAVWQRRINVKQPIFEPLGSNSFTLPCKNKGLPYVSSLWIHWPSLGDCLLSSSNHCNSSYVWKSFIGCYRRWTPNCQSYSSFTRRPSWKHHGMHKNILITCIWKFVSQSTVFYKPLSISVLEGQGAQTWKKASESCLFYLGLIKQNCVGRQELVKVGSGTKY